MMIELGHKLPLVRQAKLLELSRSSVYYLPQPTSESDLALMRILDRWHLDYPFAGSRMLRDMLRLAGHPIGRKHVATLMRKMGIGRCTAKPTPAAGTRRTGFTRTCCGDWRSSGPTRSRQWTRPTFRCARALCT